MPTGSWRSRTQLIDELLPHCWLLQSWLLQIKGLSRATLRARLRPLFLLYFDPIQLESDQSLTFCLSMIFSENRLPPRVKPGAGFFGIML